MNPVKTILLLSLLVVSGLSFADSDSKKEAENLLNMMGMKDALEQSIEQTLQVQMQQNPTLVPFKNVMMQFFQKHMSYESLKPDMVQIYADTFTASELKELIAFYRTPTGKKTIEKMPQLMAQGGQIGAKRVQDNIQELQQSIKEEAERIKNSQTKQ